MIQEKISDVQSGYDLVADEYARRISNELQHKPLDCQLLERFAETVRNTGITCDLGCGPGHVASYLHGCGITVCGMDLSPGMVSRARKLNPGIEFSQGDMRSLPTGDNAWAGITAFYAIVNLSPADVAQALHEIMRVLVPNGRLLLSFHIGEDTSQVEELWNSGAALEFHFYRAATVARYIRTAGFEIE
jgi:ubiquinone/menaquinone biosynthesis C-methylase UbiE